MKLLVVLMLVGCAFAATSKNGVAVVDAPAPVELLQQDVLSQSTSVESRNWLVNQAVNTIVNSAIRIIRNIINDGFLGLGPFDPLVIDHYHLSVPAGLINLELELNDVYATGFGAFVSNRNNLNIRTLELDLELVVPRLDIRSKYTLEGDLFRAIPLIGDGDAEFIVENFRVGALIHLAQSEDGTSVVIDRMENIRFEIPVFKSNLTGVIGGGDIDAIVNAIVEEVIMGYVHRFRGAIGILGGRIVTIVLNPVLNQLDTWRYLAPWV